MLIHDLQAVASFVNQALKGVSQNYEQEVLAQSQVCAFPFGDWMMALSVCVGRYDK